MAMQPSKKKVRLCPSKIAAALAASPNLSPSRARAVDRIQGKRVDISTSERKPSHCIAKGDESGEEVAAGEERRVVVTTAKRKKKRAGANEDVFANASAVGTGRKAWAKFQSL